MPHFYLGIGFAVVATPGWGIEGVLAIHAVALATAAGCDIIPGRRLPGWIRRRTRRHGPAVPWRR